ncbi:MAG: hypothetical protein IH986_10695 [Planctomycetes bacterium]|nr:hypothetical protein [Planctomycetota bacterium]
MTNKHDTTALIRAAAAGEPGAVEQLLAALYPELREIAHKLFGKQVRPGQIGNTLQPTALVHEAYLRLFIPEGVPATLHDREHVLNLFARCMRHVLLDYVKQRKAAKRGGGVTHVPLDGQLLAHHGPAKRSTRRLKIRFDTMIEALERLAADFPGGAKAAIATLHLLDHWSLETIAVETGLPLKDVKRDWTFARAFLCKRLAEKQP